MKKHFILKVIAVAAIALAGVSYESTAQPLDFLFVEGGGSGTGGGVGICLSTIYKFPCSISSAQNSSLSPCSPTSGQWISASPTPAPANTSTVNSMPFRVLIPFQSPEHRVITPSHSFSLMAGVVMEHLN